VALVSGTKTNKTVRVYCACLVVKGYDQVSGIDFQYNFAPITSEVTDYFCEVADVQTAFLHGNLEEELFIKIPPGYHKFFDEQKESIIKNF
jgi:hypothetical protein